MTSTVVEEGLIEDVVSYKGETLVSKSVISIRGRKIRIRYSSGTFYPFRRKERQKVRYSPYYEKGVAE